jgi:type II secretory pathway pseudopilin PulG
MRTRLDRLRGLRDDEQGTSLAELLVGMGIMATFMAIFTGAMLLMSNTVNKVEATTISSDAVNNAFLQLDRSVRYASGISATAQATTSRDWHVEFSTTTVTGDSQCVQLRLHGTTFQKRTWTPTSSTAYTASSLSKWQTMAGNITNNGTSPFTVASASSSPYQQLTIKLTASSGLNSSATPTSIAMTFAALNSNPPPSDPVCQQVAADATS